MNDGDALARSHARLVALAAVSHAFAEVATALPRLLERIARVTADAVGDGCMVTLLAPDGQTLVNTANAHRDPGLEGDYRDWLASAGISSVNSNAVSAQVYRSGQAQIAQQVDQQKLIDSADEQIKPVVRRLNVHSYAVVPIRARQVTLGTLSLVRSGPGKGYTEDDVVLLHDIADRAGLAIDNARLYEDLELRVKQRTGELELMTRELEAFSHAVAHDLRAPLRSIHGFSQALSEDHGPALGPSGLELLERVRNASLRMSRLIDGLLDLSHITSVALSRQRVDLSGLAQGLMLRLKASQPDREVQVEIERGLVVEADPTLADVLLTNLLGNAWKFTREKSPAHIELKVLHDKKPPVFVVRDNGAGFDPALSASMFQVFQRFHSAKQFEGTGVGLSTVQRIVQRHGGRVWAEASPNAGAAFYFTLEPGA